MTTPRIHALDHLVLTVASIAVIQGRVATTGATSRMASIYFYDPDENLIEVANAWARR
jgi:catechol 2,3-dioxygenase-like lactoylglutathione lyase family enzyme